jgi:serine/threonine protein kinase
MSPGSDQPLPEKSLRQSMQTHFPGISDEIQGAISTLRKIQQIAGPGSRTPHDPIMSAMDTADGSVRRDGQILAPGESFGRYQIVRLLGKGAMGAVYLSYDPQLERHVALKTPFLGSNPLTVERFLREARAAAQLRSPYICTVYDVGQIAGIHYLSMAFIDGQPLDTLIAEGKVKDLRRIAEITQKIARGLHKAHEQGIMHRDLKPANIMIDRDGEPIVMDFGLARKVDEDTNLTTPGNILGTPAYMSPEQVDGDPEKIGHATDIYSLGVVLYQMLTGRVPFEGTLTSVLNKIAHEPPKRPSVLSMTIPADAPLERICLKMMAKSSAARYPTMAAVAEALDEALPREAPAAIQPSAWEKFRGEAKRLFGFFGRGPQPATPSPAEPKKQPEAGIANLSAVASGSAIEPIKQIDVTQETSGSGFAVKQMKDTDATQERYAGGSPAKPMNDIDATLEMDAGGSPAKPMNDIDATLERYAGGSPAKPMNDIDATLERYAGGSPAKPMNDIDATQEREASGPPAKLMKGIDATQERDASNSPAKPRKDVDATQIPASSESLSGERGRDS